MSTKLERQGARTNRFIKTQKKRGFKSKNTAPRGSLLGPPSIKLMKKKTSRVPKWQKA